MLIIQTTTVPATEAVLVLCMHRSKFTFADARNKQILDSLKVSIAVGKNKFCNSDFFVQSEDAT